VQARIDELVAGLSSRNPVQGDHMQIACPRWTKLVAAHPHLQDSVETLAPMGARLELGRSHYELGVTLSEMGLREGQAALADR
jgi:hypothetical protein